MVRSNQRITKIKRDPIEELLKKAEAMDVEDACQVQPAGSDLTPYPNYDYLRLWTRDYLLKGVNAIYNVDRDNDGQSYMTTIVDGLPLFTKQTKQHSTTTGTVDFVQPVLSDNGYLGGEAFATSADSEVVTYALNTDKLTVHGTPTFTPSTSVASGFSTSNYYTLPASTQSTDGTTYVFEFTPTETVSNLQRIAHFEFVLALEIQANGGPLISYCWDTGNADVILDSVTPNTTYRVKIQVTSNKYRIVSLWQNNEWVEKINQYDPDIKLSNNSYILHIGTGSMAQDEPLTDGTINMYNSYYSIDTEPDTLYRFASVDSGALAYMATNSTSGYWQSNETATNHYLTYYNPLAINPTKVTFNNKLCTNTSYIPTEFIIRGSNDNSVWYNLATIENTNTSITDAEYSFDIDTDYSYKYLQLYINEPLSTVQVGYMKFDGQVPASIPLSTSKPGLWLSNLIAPKYNTATTGWLRSNLCPTVTSNNQNITSDTIGNYAFSFIQRGIIHREDGSTHSNNDSYSQHWSPSALSCISHEAIVIPGTQLQQTYTSYQSLVTPYSPDMQYYQETTSKDVEYEFIDNNDNIPQNLTTYVGRVVGRDWSYEFTITGNNQGSGTWGSDPGCDCTVEPVNCEECPHCPQCVDDSLRNSGACITGQITYQNDDGTVCIQAVNECFQTTQAALQPDNPNDTYTIDTYNKTDYCTSTSTGCESWWNYSGSGVRCGSDASLPFRSSWGAVDYCCSIGTWGITSEQSAISEPDCNGSLYMVCAGGKCSKDTERTNDGTASRSHCSGYQSLAGGDGKTTMKYVYKINYSAPDIDSPQSNVDVYFCITDEKQKQLAQGLPWNYSCTEMNRFSFKFSTEPCNEYYTNSIKILENISIDSLGNIPGLTDKIIEG